VSVSYRSSGAAAPPPPHAAPLILFVALEIALESFDMAVEDEFSLDISDADAASLKTVGDFIAYVERHS
jgi:hypothetical protein